MKLLSHLSRVTTPGRTFIPQIDGLRFVAIMAVLAFHVQAAYMHHADLEVVPENVVSRLFALGFLGVQLFFTISGFILAVPFAKQHLAAGPRITLSAYYLRRVTRLEPPYIIHLVFVFLLAWVVLRNMPSHPHLYHNEHWLQYLLSHLGPSLVYSHNLIFGYYPYPNIVLWSLETEIQFYLIAPFLAWLFLIAKERQRQRLLMGLILAASVLPYVVPVVLLQRFSLVGSLQYFLAGFLLADLYVTGGFQPAKNRPPAMRWDLAWLLAWTGIFLVRPYFEVGIFLPWVMFICCLAAFRGVFIPQILNNPWIVTIGGMCYTIYMYHWLMISAIFWWLIKLKTHVVWLDVVVQFGLVSAIVIPVCAVFFVLFERPFMQRDWPAKLWATLRPRPKLNPTPRL